MDDPRFTDWWAIAAQAFPAPDALAELWRNADWSTGVSWLFGHLPFSSEGGTDTAASPRQRPSSPS
jgi:hypothetical protein